MQLEHSFTVPVGPDEAFDVLTDIERVAPCMPGASLDGIDGEEFSGRVRVKVGPMQVTYQGTARFAELDTDGYRARLEAEGTETRGSGTARATITAALHDDGDDTTTVTVTTDLAITGRPAQFGRGVMADVGDKLLGQFADCLAEEVAGGRGGEDATGSQAAAPDSPAGRTIDDAATVDDEQPQVPEPGAGGDAAPTAAAQPAQPARGGAGHLGGPSRPRPGDEPIDLLEVAGGSVAKRVLPLVAGLVVVVLVIRWLTRDTDAG